MTQTPGKDLDALAQQMAHHPAPSRWPEVATGSKTDRTAEPVAASLTGSWPRLVDDDGTTPLLLAAERARVLYPGPLGELIHRELRAYLEIGHRFGGDSVITALVEELLTTTAPGSD